mmetsp:Transcript_13149/g.37129  ORF Transcript_13149/g.37129 Transcript_13149/m.37129 type:complete len:285 (-) Transcript_13149:707-1561(-)
MFQTPNQKRCAWVEKTQTTCTRLSIRCLAPCPLVHLECQPAGGSKQQRLRECSTCASSRPTLDNGGGWGCFRVLHRRHRRVARGNPTVSFLKLRGETCDEVGRGGALQGIYHAVEVAFTDGTSVARGAHFCGDDVGDQDLCLGRHPPATSGRQPPAALHRERHLHHRLWRIDPLGDRAHESRHDDGVADKVLGIGSRHSSLKAPRDGHRGRRRWRWRGGHWPPSALSRGVGGEDVLPRAAVVHLHRERLEREARDSGAGVRMPANVSGLDVVARLNVIDRPHVT